MLVVLASVLRADFYNVQIESAAYVLYLGTVFAYVYLATRPANTSRVQRKMTFVVDLLTEFTIDAYVAVKFNFSAAFYQSSALSLRTQNAHDLLYVIYDGIFGTNLLVADILLAWRCSVIWERKRVFLLLPVILCCAEICLGIAVLVVQTEKYLSRSRTP